MLDQATLTAGLERLRARLEPDITERAEEEPSIFSDLRQRHEAARAAKRTGLSFELWRAGEVTQAAVAWLLACIFVRFLEDNHLIEQPWISGPENRLAEAKEQNLRTYRAGQWQTDRDYLLLCFEEIRKLPGVSALFDKEHNPLFRLTTTGHGARAIIDFFQRADDEGNLVHDFTGTIDNTRFLGDLYQNISESARKRYALVQTPDFVVDFILNRTMEPALQEFGLDGFRLIDPACGSGHFLIAAFDRLFHKWQKRLPPMDPIDCASRALASVYGVDLNPFAIAIARFRLLVAALRSCKVERLSEAPNFKTKLAVGDSLLHGTRPGTSGAIQRHAFDETLNFYYDTEDREELRDYLMYETYHAVVGNPPYISVADPVLREIYRTRFASCLGRYQMTAPFLELFFDLARRGESAGFVGTITAISFAKRAFGRRLVVDLFPQWQFTLIVDSSRAHIPNHGTPTVMLFATNRHPTSRNVRVVRGIRGEAKEPLEPSTAAVWTAIIEQVDCPGSESRFVSVSDLDLAKFYEHPWSIGGGGAAELKEALEEGAGSSLGEIVAEIGITAVNGEDDLFVLDDYATASRLRIECVRPLVRGDDVREWLASSGKPCIWPYGPDYAVTALTAMPNTAQLLWAAKG